MGICEGRNCHELSIISLSNLFQTDCPFSFWGLEGELLQLSQHGKQARQKLLMSFPSVNTEPSWQECRAGVLIGHVCLGRELQRNLSHRMASSCEFLDAQTDDFFFFSFFFSAGGSICCSKQLIGSVVGILRSASSLWKPAHFMSGNESWSRQCCQLKQLTSLMS